MKEIPESINVNCNQRVKFGKPFVTVTASSVNMKLNEMK